MVHSDLVDSEDFFCIDKSHGSLENHESNAKESVGWNERNSAYEASEVAEEGDVGDSRSCRHVPADGRRKVAKEH